VGPQPDDVEESSSEECTQERLTETEEQEGGAHRQPPRTIQVASDESKEKSGSRDHEAVRKGTGHDEKTDGAFQSSRFEARHVLYLGVTNQQIPIETR
jgi:hypothetical protein